MTVTVPNVASIVQFTPGPLAGDDARRPYSGFAFQGGTINLSKTGSGAVAAPHAPMTGDATIVPAIVMAAGGGGGLLAHLLVFLNDQSVVAIKNLPHVSTNPAGPCWQWGEQAAFPGVNA
jgi:hypothetical protein